MARQVRKVKTKNQNIEDLFGLIDLAKVEEVKQETEVFISVEDVLRKYKNFHRVLWAGEVEKYIQQCEKNGIVAIDTETNDSLDPRSAIIVGICLYTPYNRPVYIPVNHTDQVTGDLVPNQISIEDLSGFLIRLKKLFCIYHNAKFDVNIIRYNTRIIMPINWDTMIVAKILDENIYSAALKTLYRNEIEPAQPTYNIRKFFSSNQTADIKQFGLYSAMDPYETFKLFESQKHQLDFPSMVRLKDLLLKLELPVCEVLADIEQDGVGFDQKLCEHFTQKFSASAEIYQEEANKFFAPIKDQVVQWPIVLTSPNQVVDALCLMGIQVENSQADTLEALSKRFPICRTILNYRSDTHMITSFFKPLSEFVHPNTNKIHANFNQLGGEDKTIKTGRMNSTKPNLQQVPAFTNSVRLCFVAGQAELTEEIKERFYLSKVDAVRTAGGYVKAYDLKVGDILKTSEGNVPIYDLLQEEGGVMVQVARTDSFEISLKLQNTLFGSDYSQQEPKLMTSLSQETALIEGYNLRSAEFPKGKDYYAQVAMAALNKEYWECVEFTKPKQNIDYENNGFSSKYFVILEDGTEKQASSLRIGDVVETDTKPIKIENLSFSNKKIIINNNQKLKVKINKIILGEYSKEGKSNRTVGKTIQLGLGYSMGAARLAGLLDVDYDEAVKILNNFFSSHKNIAMWRDFNLDRMGAYGFMETVLGRRRRLPDVFLPPCEVKVFTDEPIKNIFPNIAKNTLKVLDKETSDRYTAEMSKLDWKAKEKRKKTLEAVGYTVIDNGGFLARTKTQCTNSVVQGSAADLTKLALLEIAKSPVLNKYKAKAIFLIHDEIIVEGPMRYKDEIEAEFIDCMCRAALPVCEVLMACDGEIETRWRLHSEISNILKTLEEEGPDGVYLKYSEYSKKSLDEIINGKFNPEIDILEIA